MKLFQNLLLGISLLLLASLPLFVVFGPDMPWAETILYKIAFITVSLVMLVRPLADIFRSQVWLRKLVFFRKGFGVLSASIIVGFMLGNVINPDSTYFTSLVEPMSWQKALAHVADFTGLILLITSNNFSMVLLKKNWKRIQKLAYVYFYAGGVYQYSSSGDVLTISVMIFVTLMVVLAFFINQFRK